MFYELVYDVADLAEMINLVHHDLPKVLNLLRGFFYWLTVRMFSFCKFLVFVEFF